MAELNIMERPNRVPAKDEELQRYQDEVAAWGRQLVLAMRSIVAEVAAVRGAIPTVPEADEELGARLQQLETIVASIPTSRVKTPVFSPANGALTVSDDYPIAVEITCGTPGSMIRYSKTAVPTAPTEGFEYTAPVAVDRNDVLYARAFRSGFLDSYSRITQYESNDFADNFSNDFS